MAQHWSAVIAPAAVDEVRATLKPLATGGPGAVARVRSTALRRDGTEIPAEISGVPLFRDGEFRGIQGTIRDLRAQVRLERELRDQAGALAASAERAHLARELHDSVTQALFSMGLITRSIEVLLDRDPPAAREKLGDLRELQRDALAEMRSLIFELRPGSLEREGLASALRTHVAALEGRLGLPIVLDVAEVERLPLPAEDALYRIAQEALHNIVKHARARTVRIELARDGAEVTLRIADDGVGFDPGDVADGHLGIAGMRARAERAGGHLAVRSAPDEGTEILVGIPAPGDPPPD
jgi:signal transduction histidine kinase